MELDAADWPKNAGDCAVLRQLDEAATCAICHGPYSVPLALPCGHSFCAECIRSNLEFQERTAPAKCPQCRERCDPRQLHANKALQNIVNTFIKARVQLAKLADGPCPAAVNTKFQKSKGYSTRSKAAGKVHKGNNAQRQDHEPTQGGVQPQKPESSSSQSHSQAGSSQSSPESDYRPSQRANSAQSADVSDDQSPASEDPVHLHKRRKTGAGDRQHEGDVPQTAANAKQRAADSSAAYLTCPNCSASVPSAVINDHLDRCLEGHTGRVAAAASGPGKTSSRIKSALGGPAGELQVPPKLAMSLLKDKDLRQKLKQYSLPVNGKRQELEQRYSRFRVAVQTALDRGDSQLTYAELARRLVARDKQAANAGMPSQIMAKAPRSDAAGPDQGNGFSGLIQATKARRAARAPALHDLTGEDTPGSESTPLHGLLAQPLANGHKAQSVPVEASLREGGEGKALEPGDAGQPLRHAESTPDAGMNGLGCRPASGQHTCDRPENAWQPPDALHDQGFGLQSCAADGCRDLHSDVVADSDVSIELEI